MHGAVPYLNKVLEIRLVQAVLIDKYPPTHNVEHHICEMLPGDHFGTGPLQSIGSRGQAPQLLVVFFDVRFNSLNQPGRITFEFFRQGSNCRGILIHIGNEQP